VSMENALRIALNAMIAFIVINAKMDMLLLK
jgi:hypothetical protein